MNESCITLDKAEYYQDYTNSPKIGYLTGDIALYKYPYMTNLLTLESLSRAEEVKVIGEVITLDYAYYKVTVESESGTKTGYIPKPFITLFDGSHAEMNTTVIGDTATDHDSVWRFVYLILGFGAICILTDFLILRKSKKDD